MQTLNGFRKGPPVLILVRSTYVEGRFPGFFELIDFGVEDNNFPICIEERTVLTALADTPLGVVILIPSVP